MAKIHLSRIKSSAFKISSYAGPSVVVRVDTGADINCMNEKTFNELFPEVQNFRNSTADISILGQFCTYLEFRGEKYLNTYIITNANDCPNLLSYGATLGWVYCFLITQRRT